MKLNRSIVLVALGALALPVAAQQHPAAPAAQGNSIRPVAPPSAPAPTPASADIVLVPNRAVGATLAAAAGLTTYPVDAQARRPISPECVYRSTVHGTLRTTDSASGDAEIRDADLRTEAAIVCRGQTVTRRSEHLVLPEATARELSTNLEKALSVARPGQRCLYSVALTIEHGRVAPERAINVCKPDPDPFLDRPNLARAITTLR
jgi:hypothetical protein